MDVDQSNAQHLTIARAVADGDEDKAGLAMAEHIRALHGRLEKLQAQAPRTGRFPERP
ncbi:MAG: FCD domain-containing protein [Devosia sp.]|nr:FCD domain-containing protein [Devosia sp.]